MKSGSLNLVERSRPVKDRTGIALSLPSTFHIYTRMSEIRLTVMRTICVEGIRVS